LTVHVYKEGEKYYPIEVFDYPDLKKTQGNRKLGLPHVYYSSAVLDEEKERYKPKNIKGE
jgi:hypothetical protein